MLLAQALVEDLELVAGDERMRRYPVRTIWTRAQASNGRPAASQAVKPPSSS